MSVKNGKFNFYDVELVCTNPSGKFYFQTPKSKGRVYEVTVEHFKLMLVTASEARRLGTEYSNQSNSLEYLLDQLEMTEDLFTALLYPEWINEEY
jgi:Glu-tRNA(Gln) amidotransferase subunit E-like FAD-binding protein